MGKLTVHLILFWKKSPEERLKSLRAYLRLKTIQQKILSAFLTQPRNQNKRIMGGCYHGFEKCRCLVRKCRLSNLQEILEHSVGHLLNIAVLYFGVVQLIPRKNKIRHRQTLLDLAFLQMVRK